MNEVLDLEVDPKLFRRAMGRFTTGVTVITAADGEHVRGMTANAFMSGSLEPPLCIISIAKRARMHEAISRADHFGVSILAESQIEVSDHFAGRPSATVNVEFERLGPAHVLADACARIAARIIAHHDCGDHTIFIGQILRLEADDRPPLVYHAGRYRALDQGRLDHNVGSPEFW